MLTGSGNRVAKNTTFSSPTSKGPQLNALMGGFNNIQGGEHWYYNMIAGVRNGISATTGDYVQNNFILGKGNSLIGGAGGSGAIENNFIFGKENKIVGLNGTIVTRNVFLNGEFLTNIDQYNVARTNVFMIGKGTSVSSPLRPSDIGNYQFSLGTGVSRRVRIMFGGTPNAYLLAGAWQNSGADYGEYFEWNDGNQIGEDRVGYFVEITDGKIQIAKSGKAIGIVSKATAFIGDSNQDEWSGKYLKDEWGVPVMEKFQKFALSSDESQKEVYFDAEGFCYSEIPNRKNRQSVKIDVVKEQGTFVENVDVQVENPNYDPEKRYIPRKDRKEWDVIGLLGKLKVRTSEQITGSAVDVDAVTGMAKNGTT